MNGDLHLCDIKERACEIFRRSGCVDIIGRDNIFTTKTELARPSFPARRQVLHDLRRKIFRERPKHATTA